MTTPNAFRPARLGTSCFAGPGSTFAAGWHNRGEGNAADTAESRRVAAVPDAAKLKEAWHARERRTHEADMCADLFLDPRANRRAP